MGVGGGFRAKNTRQIFGKTGPLYTINAFQLLLCSAQQNGFHYHFWSPDEIRRDLQNRACPSVRVCVRVYVTRFLGNRSSHRSETLGKVWDQNFRKRNTAGFFEKFPVPRKSGGTRQKMPQIEVFDTQPENATLLFSNFFFK